MESFKQKMRTFFSRTGESVLKNYTYIDNKINLEIELYDEDILSLEFTTEVLYSKKNEQKIPFNTGYLDCIELSDVLEIENNHYTFSGDFVGVMKAQRNKLNLAFGLNISKYTHLIIFRNDSINLAFLVNEKDIYNISIT